MINYSTAHLVALMRELNSALITLDIACGTNSEFEFIPQTRDLPGLHELHDKALVPMSYHLVTARGATRLMLSHQYRYTLVLLAVNCLFSTLKAAENIRPNLALMRQSAPTQFKGAVNTTEKWAMRTIAHTRNGLKIMRDMVGPLWPNILAELGIYSNKASLFC